jgi:hypothetical protein|uniref:Uncharacterized protein n=1 Tax=viral metagenome TaxID=1070528 RepID=A0A6C0EEP3_9ZZZZ
MIDYIVIVIILSILFWYFNIKNNTKFIILNYNKTLDEIEITSSKIF